MLIRIVKRLPAPQMDGFDVQRFISGRLYDVDNRLGRYLIVSEYAERVDENVSDTPSSPASKRLRVDEKCDQCGSLLVLPHIAAGFAIPSHADYVCLKCQRSYRWDGQTLALARIVL